jgi:hypothetical protein
MKDCTKKVPPVQCRYEMDKALSHSATFEQCSELSGSLFVTRGYGKTIADCVVNSQLFPGATGLSIRISPICNTMLELGLLSTAA